MWARVVLGYSAVYVVNELRVIYELFKLKENKGDCPSLTEGDKERNSRTSHPSAESFRQINESFSNSIRSKRTR